MRDRYRSPTLLLQIKTTLYIISSLIKMFQKIPLKLCNKQLKNYIDTLL